jgi:hypothetical protein
LPSSPFPRAPPLGRQRATSLITTTSITKRNPNDCTSWCHSTNRRASVIARKSSLAPSPPSEDLTRVIANSIHSETPFSSVHQYPWYPRRPLEPRNRSSGTSIRGDLPFTDGPNTQSAGSPSRQIRLSFHESCTQNVWKIAEANNFLRHLRSSCPDRGSNEFSE